MNLNKVDCVSIEEISKYFNGRRCNACKINKANDKIDSARFNRENIAWEGMERVLSRVK